MSDTQFSIEYIPPSRETFYRFARQVCQEMEETLPQRVQDLTDFLVICATIHAKFKSRKVKDYHEQDQKV